MTDGGAGGACTLERLPWRALLLALLLCAAACCCAPPSARLALPPATLDPIRLQVEEQLARLAPKKRRNSSGGSDGGSSSDEDGGDEEEEAEAAQPEGSSAGTGAAADWPRWEDGGIQVRPSGGS